MKSLNLDDADEGIEDGVMDVSVVELQSELNSAVADASWFVVQCADDFQTRHCQWPGQSDDGRKYKDNLGKDPFPWEGASDVKVRLADTIVNDHVRIIRSATKRSLLQAVPVERSDQDQANAVSTFVRWLLQKKMKQNLRREIPLLANWQETYGLSVLAVTWDEEVRMRKRALTMEDLAAAVAQADEVDPEDAAKGRGMMEGIFDPARTDEVAAWLCEMFSDLKLPIARRCVVALRDKGECKIPVSEVVRSVPMWTALRAFRDVFFPTNTVELQNARWIAWREAVSCIDLKSRIITEDYDEDAVNLACESCEGKSILDFVKWENGSGLLDAKVVDDMAELVEVIHFYRRVIDEDGFPNIMVTKFVPSVDTPLQEELLDYRHGQYPFIDFCRDRTERILLENRSVPQLARTHQSEVKTQRDYRTDRTSVTINPPLEVPMWRADKPLEFGPGKKIPYRKLGENQWMRPPQFDGDTINIEQQVRRDVDDYFGRMSEAVHPSRQMLYGEAMVDDFLGGLLLAAEQTLALCDQFSPELFARVTGQQLQLADGDVRGAYDLLMEFNAADLNLEHVLKKAEVMNSAILPADQAGVIDRAAWVQYLARSLDPILAGVVVQDMGAVTGREVKDEQANFALIMAGTEPDMAQAGQNWALRMKVLQGILQSNPDDINRDLANKPKSQEMLQRRLEHFQFMLQQQQNATIGKIGAMPALNNPQG